MVWLTDWSVSYTHLDDVDRLPQRQQPGIDKTDHHDRRGRGTLDHSRDPEARGKTGQFPAGHLPQQRAELAARAALERLPHQVHSEQEQTYHHAE